MIPYFALLIFVSLYICLERVTLNRKAFIVPFFALVSFASVRNFTVGTDSIAYVEKFRSNLDSSYYKYNPDIEKGYQFLEYVLLNFTHNYFWLFFVTSVFYLYLFLSTFKKYSVNYLISIFVFICFGSYTFYFNGLRHGLSIAVLTLTLPYLIDRKIIKYSLVVGVASLFHVSALVFLPFYFLVYIRIKIEAKILLVFLLSFFISAFTIKFLASNNRRYENYTMESDKAGGYITLGFYALIALFFYFFGSKPRVKYKIYNISEQIFICGVVLILPLALLGTDPSGPQRLIFSFSWLLALMFPYLFKYIEGIYLKGLFVILGVVYFYLITSRFGDLTPYILNDIFRII